MLQKSNLIDLFQSRFSCLVLSFGALINSFKKIVQENTRYTFRLRNQGGKTHNGDGGVLTVKGPDGTLFNFSACLLSFNGTNHIRGQLPHVLYCK